jgi:Gram-negative bacterial TonB protein C-terminal
MNREIFAALAMLAITAPALAQSGKQPLVLKQASPWNVDYANDQCRLIRQFGSDEEKVFAIFDRYGPGERFRLTVAGKPVKTSHVKGELTIRFGPSEGEQTVEFYSGTTADYPSLIIQKQMRVAPLTPAEQVESDKSPDGVWVDLPSVGPEREGAIRNLTVGKPLRQSIVLETGSMRKPFEALGKCVDNLMTTWGIDVDKHRSLLQDVKPLTSPGKWIVPDDYPVKMLSAGQPAIVEFRLSVGADGKPASCHIQSTTRPKEFDNAVCGSLMRRARFAPALDADGQPLVSFYRNTVRFAIP